MSFFPAMLIQFGLIFLPFVIMLLANARVRGRAGRVLIAFFIAVSAGWAAYHASADLGWKPVLKGGHVAGLSPVALFWAFFAGHSIALLFFALPKDRAIRTVAPPDPSGAPLPPGQATWRVGHVGRDGMFYEEYREGRWERLEISGEMLLGRAHHVIYFDSPEAWVERRPEWARNRRDEIIARIKSAFQPPDYEYYGA
jgi:hypothetical protein